MAEEITSPLLSLIKEQGLIDDLQYEEVTAEMKRSGTPAFQILQDFGILDLDSILQAMANHLSTEVVSLRNLDLPQDLVGSDPLVAATFTSAFGSYTFTGLGAGRYFVAVDAGTLPDLRLVATGPDPSASVTVLATNSSSNFTVNAGFGQTTNFVLGERVWSDATATAPRTPARSASPACA